MAMLIQNTNPMEVAPEQRKVRAGFAREDLFTVVHEQFLTETARMADIVLPATTFLEHEDIYTSSGHTHLHLAPKLVEPPGECRTNHDVICGIATRVGAEHRGFSMPAEDILEETLTASGYGGRARFAETGFIDCAAPFERAHFLDGFGWPDKKFRFRADWAALDNASKLRADGFADLPAFPDQWTVNEAADAAHPLKLVTAPARAYLNSTFNTTPSSVADEGEPRALMHPDDLVRFGLEPGAGIRLGNQRGEIALTAVAFAGAQPGVVIVESIPANARFAGGVGLNTLTSADRVAPFGGAAFHDTHVWVRPSR